MYDFQVYWAAARAVLEGLSPYTTAGYLSPPILAWLFIPFGLLGWKAAAAAWLLVTTGGLLVWCRRDPGLLSWKTLCFAPVLFLVAMGQIDLLVMLGGLWGPAALLGLLVFLKPQLGVALLLWRWLQWPKDKRGVNLVTVAGVAVTVWLAMGWLHPGWVGEWQAATPSLGAYAGTSASIWGLGWLGIPVVIGASLLFKRRNPASLWSVFALLNPVSNAYSLVVLLPYLDWGAVALSWVAMIFAPVLHTGGVFVIVPLYLLWREANKIGDIGRPPKNV